jgi:hypothetical protein
MKRLPLGSIYKERKREKVERKKKKGGTFCIKLSSE